jgi:glycosyltransferase involved in cell wall biosynthesis
MGGWIDRYATHGLACSDVAARSMYGESWQSDGRWRILHYGIDPGAFSERVVADRERAELGIPAGARVVGHVGRFVEQKNHAFLVEVIAESVALDPDICFLLVGEGPLKPQVERVIGGRGLAGNVVFTGARSDVPRLMLSAMDVFVFPSLWEGLGIVLLEAQAAGLPALVSQYVPRECAVIPGQVEHLRLSEGAKCWARNILRCLDREPLGRAEALAAVSDSRFTVQRSARALQDAYESSLSS